MAVIAPTNLNATTVSAVRIDLTWTNGQTYSAVNIYRKVDGGSWGTVTSVSGTATSYSNTGLTGGIKYWYRLTGTYGGEDSDYSVYDSAITTLPPPTLCDAVCASSSSADISWADNSSTETSFQIYKDGGYLATVGANVKTYTATSLTSGTTYAFKVRALNSIATSAFSNTDNVTITSPPDKPTGLTVTISGTSFNLAWSDNSSNETGFKIAESEDDGAYSVIATVGANVESYERTGRSENVKYAYKVRSYNADGNSEYTNPVTRGMWTATPTADSFSATDTGTTDFIDVPGTPQSYTASGTDTCTMSDSYITVLQDTDDWMYYLGSNAGLVYPYAEAYEGDAGTEVEAYYKTKAMDFSEQFPQLADTYKTITRIYLTYLDLQECVVRVAVSTDNGTTWTEVVKTLGDGDLTVKTARYDFVPVTGRFFVVKLSHSSSTSVFQWVRLKVEFDAHADWFSVA